MNDLGDHDRDRPTASLALIEEARQRRQRGAGIRREQPAVNASVLDSAPSLDERHVATSIAAVLDEQDDSATADEILEQIASGSPPPAVPPSATRTVDGPAISGDQHDEIRDAIERPYRQSQSHERSSAPRGSADLPPAIPQSSSRRQSTRPAAHARRRARRPGKRVTGVTVVGVMAVAVIAASSLAARSDHPRAGPDRPAVAAVVALPVTIEQAVTEVSASVEKQVSAAETAHAQQAVGAKHKSEQEARARAHDQAAKAHKRQLLREQTLQDQSGSATTTPAASAAVSSAAAPTTGSSAPTTSSDSSSSSGSTSSKRPDFGEDGILGPGSSPASK